MRPGREGEQLKLSEEKASRGSRACELGMLLGRWVGGYTKRALRIAVAT